MEFILWAFKQFYRIAQNANGDSLVLITKCQESEWKLALKVLPFVDHYGLSDFNEYTSADSECKRKRRILFFCFSISSNEWKRATELNEPVGFLLQKKLFFGTQGKKDYFPFHPRECAFRWIINGRKEKNNFIALRFSRKSFPSQPR